MLTITYLFQNQLRTCFGTNGYSLLTAFLTIVLSGVSRKMPLKESHVHTTKPHKLNLSLEVPIRYETDFWVLGLHHWNP